MQACSHRISDELLQAPSPNMPMHMHTHMRTHTHTHTHTRTRTRTHTHTHMHMRMRMHGTQAPVPFIFGAARGAVDTISVHELAPHLLCVDLPARRLRFPPSPPLPPLPAALRSPLLAALQRAEGDMQRNEGCVHVPRNTVAPRPTSASTPSSASAPAPAAPGPAVRLALPNEDELTDDSWRGVAHEVRCACAAAMAPLAEAA
jgi:hypothetical protein